MRRDESLFIDGGWDEATDGTPLDVIDAATEQVLESVRLGGVADADRAVEAARRAFDGWAATPIAERVALLERTLELLTADEGLIARTVTHEVGTPVTSSIEIQARLALADVRNSLAAVTEIEWERQIGNSLIVREPAGVVAAITPWNYPLHQVCAKVAPALLAGCTVVLKPSELAPLTAFMLTEALQKAGVPNGVFNLVLGTGPVVGAALAAHPGVDMVSLTGSVGAGRSVMAAGAQGIKRVALELGGKSSMVVLDDAPLAEAVGRTVSSCYSNNGQTCSALTRLLVHEDQLDEVEELAADAARRYVVGDPMDPATTLGPLVSKEQQQQVQSYVQIGIDEGASLVAGSPDTPAELTQGFYVAPSVLSGVTDDMRVAQEEIFGPVLTIMAYRDDDDAVRLANGTAFGLSGGVWSGDPSRAQQVARRLRTGQVSVNGGRFNPAAPFGGYKQSGVGRELGIFGLEEFLEAKALHQ